MNNQHRNNERRHHHSGNGTNRNRFQGGFQGGSAVPQGEDSSWRAATRGNRSSQQQSNTPVSSPRQGDANQVQRHLMSAFMIDFMMDQDWSQFHNWEQWLQDPKKTIL